VEHTEDVLGSEVGLVAHLLAGMNVVPYIRIIRNVTHRQGMVSRLRRTHVVVAVIVLEREGNFAHRAQLSEFPLLICWVVAVWYALCQLITYHGSRAYYFTQLTRRRRS
jgi:hypothetical protein